LRRKFFHEYSMNAVDARAARTSAFLRTRMRASGRIRALNASLKVTCTSLVGHDECPLSESQRTSNRIPRRAVWWVIGQEATGPRLAWIAPIAGPLRKISS
jgi:hypothetical protein